MEHSEKDTGTKFSSFKTCQEICHLLAKQPGSWFFGSSFKDISACQLQWIQWVLLRDEKGEFFPSRMQTHGARESMPTVLPAKLLGCISRKVWPLLKNRIAGIWKCLAAPCSRQAVGLGVGQGLSSSPAEWPSVPLRSGLLSGVHRSP